MKKRMALAAIASLAILAGSTPARAQAVEIFAGDDASTVDVMFFNYFKDGAGQPSPVLLFHRSRVLVDYDIDSSSRRNLPQFGMTNAVSYNPKALRGFAPVAVVSITTSAVAAKVGLQYARVRPTHTMFGWVVSETAARPAFDVFMLGRYVHRLTPAVGIFTQVESLSVLPTDADAPRCSSCAHGWESTWPDSSSAWAPMFAGPPDRRRVQRPTSGSSRGTHSERSGMD